MTISLFGEAQPQRQSSQFLVRARLSRVKLCAEGMRNAILENDLKMILLLNVTSRQRYKSTLEQKKTLFMQLVTVAKFQVKNKIIFFSRRKLERVETMGTVHKILWRRITDQLAHVHQSSTDQWWGGMQRRK